MTARACGGGRCPRGRAYRYRVWDDAGRELFKSEAFGVALTAVAWRPAGDCFAVAMHGRLVLCNAAGWATASHAHASGSALALAWTPDGVGFAATCGDGAVLVGGVLDACQEIGTLQVRRPLRHTHTPALDCAHTLPGGAESS